MIIEIFSQTAYYGSKKNLIKFFKIYILFSLHLFTYIYPNLSI